MFRIVRVAANFLLQMVEDSFKLSWKMFFFLEWRWFCWVALFKRMRNTKIQNKFDFGRAKRHSPRSSSSKSGNSFVRSKSRHRDPESKST